MDYDGDVTNTVISNVLYSYKNYEAIIISTNYKGATRYGRPYNFADYNVLGQNNYPTIRKNSNNVEDEAVDGDEVIPVGHKADA